MATLNNPVWNTQRVGFKPSLLASLSPSLFYRTLDLRLNQCWPFIIWTILALIVYYGYLYAVTFVRFLSFLVWLLVDFYRKNLKYRMTLRSIIVHGGWLPKSFLPSTRSESLPSSQMVILHWRRVALLSVGVSFLNYPSPHKLTFWAEYLIAKYGKDKAQPPESGFLDNLYCKCCTFDFCFSVEFFSAFRCSHTLRRGFFDASSGPKVHLHSCPEKLADSSSTDREYGIWTTWQAVRPTGTQKT